jgi:hydrogenase maturation protein HypF
MSLLHAAFGCGFAELPLCQALADASERDMVAQMLRSDACCVPSSSAGRLFDGVAALLGLCQHNQYEAQAPCLLEAAAAQSTSALPLHLDDWALHQCDGLIEVDWSGLIRRLVGEISRGAEAGQLAMYFHQALAAALADAAAQAAQATGIKTVALSGGVFGNELFGEALSARLEQLGLRVLRHRQLPPNDGSIAFGQAAVAQARYACGRG